jgi:hypothetical protein
MCWCVFRLHLWLNGLFHLTAKRLHPIIYALICLQITLMNEWLITCHSKTTVLYYTSQTNGAPCYGCVGVSSEDWKMNDLLHTSQQIGHSPLRMCWCLSDDLLHTSHQNGRSWLWMCWCLQIRLSDVWLIKHITAKRLLSTMRAFMCHQIILMTEWLVTHITAK